MSRWTLAPLLLGLLAACDPEADPKADPDDDTGGLVLEDADNDGYTVEDDCDDEDPAINPDASERCNEIDDDCDDEIDEDVATTWYLDGDRDGFGEDETTWEGCEPPPGYVEEGGDCDDLHAESHPGAEEVCDGLDNDCNAEVDEGVTTTFYLDSDGDGAGAPAPSTEACDLPDGYAETDDDCDDTDPAVNPDATEFCNEGIDDDCDGLADDEDDAVAGTSTWYLDADGDGYGLGGSPVESCAPPADYVEDASDCNDTDIGINPGATEVCDAADADEDCDGVADDDDSSVSATSLSTFYEDGDNDGYGNPSSTIQACDAPSGHIRDATDCDDSAASISPAATEVCNSIDDDCDSDIDDADSSVDLSTGSTFYTDADNDGFGDPLSPISACVQPSGAVTDDTDCDDSSSSINTDATEDCNGIDDDCDGTADNGTLGTDPTCAAISCDEILADDPSATDGAYYLDPEATGAYLNWCEMNDDGGGWTLVFSCSAEDYSHGSGWNGWWQDGYTSTLDDTADEGKSKAFDEVDFEDIRLTATYPDASTLVASTGSVRDDLHDLIGSEITTCSGLTGTPRYSYTASSRTGSYFYSSTLGIVACDTDGSDLETTSDGNYDAAIFATYLNQGDNNYADGSIGSEFTCGGSQYSYGISSNTLRVWVR